MDKKIQAVIHELFGVMPEVTLTRPEPQFGDFATNVALQIAKPLGKNPREIAEMAAARLREDEVFSEVSVAGPGFINLRMADEWLLSEFTQGAAVPQELKDQEIVVEYLDPNPFKEVHIGHAYSGTVGDALASLYEAAGARVHRVTYQGDVGLHVAKAMYAILRRIDNNPERLEAIHEAERVRFLGEAYAEGAAAYEADSGAKGEIDQLNKHIYALDDPTIRKVYEIGRRWSLDYFGEVYSRLGFTPFEKNYMERAVADVGLQTVREHITDGVFEKSEGAVIFRGEKYGLHTRVFVNSLGLPTYDAKDLGLAPLKWQDYHYDKSIIITANEQAQYFEVMLKALEQFAPELSRKTTHLSHGFVTLSTGKMSSRTGKVLRAMEVFDQIEAAVRTIAKDADDTAVRDIALAALKYSFLKNRVGGDIVFNIHESVSVEGNSGPYLQYAHARARSILNKTSVRAEITEAKSLDTHERALTLKLLEYPEVLAKATRELLPHYICTYLYELAQTFNRFYENNRVIGDEREALRLALLARYAETLKKGLEVLNIPAPERM